MDGLTKHLQVDHITGPLPFGNFGWAFADREVAAGRFSSQHEALHWYTHHVLSADHIYVPYVSSWVR